MMTCGSTSAIAAQILSSVDDISSVMTSALTASALTTSADKNGLADERADVAFGRTGGIHGAGDGEV